MKAFSDTYGPTNSTRELCSAAPYGPSTSKMSSTLWGVRAADATRSRPSDASA